MKVKMRMTHQDIQEEKRIVSHLKNLRQKKGITQQQIADHIGCSKQTISLLERGEAALYLSRLQGYCRVVGCRLDILLEETGGEQ